MRCVDDAIELLGPAELRALERAALDIASKLLPWYADPASELSPCDVPMLSTLLDSLKEIGVVKHARDLVRPALRLAEASFEIERLANKLRIPVPAAQTH